MQCGVWKKNWVPKLLNRTSRAVKPTDLGLDLAEKLAGGFDVIDDALHAVQAPGAARFGELRINAFADAAFLLLTPRPCPNLRVNSPMCV